jgi:trimethylamine--corrinoid protein Co-methyltransferase
MAGTPTESGVTALSQGDPRSGTPCALCFGPKRDSVIIMHVAGHTYNPMSSTEVGLIHSSALRILREAGMEVQNHCLLEALAELGLEVDYQSQRIRFPSSLVEHFISEAQKHDWDRASPQISASAGVYHGLIHDPMSNELVPWTEESLALYFALPRQLPHVEVTHMLGCRLPVPGPLEPLYERYYAWKYGGRESGTIHLDELCPYIMELYQLLAEHRGQPVEEVFRGTVYLVPPLKLGRHEAYQVSYFRERGLRVRIGDSYALGATAPATLAGAVALNLAEQLALRILEWALYGEKRLHIGSSMSVMDMRTLIYPYGRPEMAIANVMTAQLARHYGASFSGHAGLTDAKLPSVEAGAQKALTAIPTLLAGGNLSLDAGLLSIDEVCSPVQMILDNEFLSALQRFVHDFEITEEVIGLDTIIDVGPGGHFMDKLHTAHHFRSEHWEPGIWSRRMLAPWMDRGCRLDADQARELALDIQARGTEVTGMSDELEQEVLGVIERARRMFIAS